MHSQLPTRNLAAELQGLRSVLEQSDGASDPRLFLRMREAVDRIETLIRSPEVVENLGRTTAAEELWWDLKRRVADLTCKLRDREIRLREIERSPVWKLAKPVWKLFRNKAHELPGPYTGVELVHVIDWPREWNTSRTKLLIEGWCFLLNGREIAAVRANVGGHIYVGQYGSERPDVAREGPPWPTARNSGFAVEVPIAVGTSTMHLEAIEPGGPWRVFAERVIVRDAATIDEVPLPPHRLMAAVAGHDNDEEFGRSRLGGPTQMLLDLVAAGVEPQAIHDLLDFGCGCGRFLAGWLLLHRKFRVYGCDYNPELVTWCNANLPGVAVSENRLGQPLPYGDNSFDLIYLLSVFTHLTLPEQEQVVSEFRRVLRPGGYVYVTFHGEPFYERLFARVENRRQQFREDGFLIGADEEEGTNECWTLHSPEHLVRLFEGFTPLKHFRASERGPTDVASWQDSMIFQREGTPNSEGNGPRVA